MTLGSANKFNLLWPNRGLVFFVALVVGGIFYFGPFSTTPLIANGGGVPEIEGYRMNDFRKPVPKTLKGAHVIDTGEAEDLWNEKTAVFIDVYPKPPKPPNLPKDMVWREPKHKSIKGSVWLPNVGYGKLSPSMENYFRSHLQRLSGGDKGKQLVFFCLRDCWMSWNAAKRASSWGYSKVIWFPDGSDGWEELGLPLVNLSPEPEPSG